jgi:hypothetical protein
MKREVTQEVCAYCIGVLYKDSTRYCEITTSSAGDPHAGASETLTVESNWYPEEIIKYILQGSKVHQRGTGFQFSLAVTTINGTAYCGFHASERFQGRITL